MNEYQIQTMKLLFRRKINYLCENLDFPILKTHLISHDILPSERKKIIAKSKVKFEQISLLVEFLIEEESPKIYQFFKILEDESLGYKFVYDHLHEELTTLVQTSSTLLQTIAKTKPGGEARVANLKFRHFLKRLVHSNELDLFDRYQQKIMLEWKKCTNFSQKHLFADRYCMVLDAELERGLVRADRTLVQSRTFTEVLNCAPYTSNPNVYIMLYLARYAYALFFNGESYEEVMAHIHQAVSHMTTIEPCRETGIVLYILYNMKSISYENHPTKWEKMQLLDIAKQAVYHFSKEGEVISEDFRRLFFIKSSMLYLGISIFGHNITNLSISGEDIRHAKDCLRKVTAKKMWQRMEVRWKMFYYMCVVKYLQLKDPEKENLTVQIRLAKRAKACSIKGGHSVEGKNIDFTLQHLLDVQSSLSK